MDASNPKSPLNSDYDDNAYQPWAPDPDWLCVLDGADNIQLLDKCILRNREPQLHGSISSGNWARAQFI